MRVRRLRAREFRTYARLDVTLGEGLTVIHGGNGAGKSNLLEALYFGCTARSCRTSNEREVVRFGAPATHVDVDLEDIDEVVHTLSVGFEPGQPKRLKADGADVEGLLEVQARPLVSVFLPDRLELVKGPPALRRGHLDQVIAATWPGRAVTRRAYGQAVAQRNALLARIRAGRASRASLPAWDAEVARHGVVLRDHRAEACASLVEPFSRAAADLGLTGDATLRYRPRTDAPDADTFAAELAERADSDLDRGFTAHGPHRDDIVLQRDGRELRAYGSQGEQRLGLLALLLAEREVLAEARGALPLLLLDDVMSELDPDRRAKLALRLDGPGQSVITTTDLAHVPGSEGPSVSRIAVRDGAALVETAA